MVIVPVLMDVLVLVLRRRGLRHQDPIHPKNDQYEEEGQRHSLGAPLHSDCVVRGEMAKTPMVTSTYD